MPTHSTRNPWSFLSLTIPLAILAIFLVLFTARATAQPGEGSPAAFAPDRLIVQLRADTADSIEAVVVRNPVRSAQPLFTGASGRNGLERIYVLDLPSGSDVPQAAQILASDPGVEWVEPDYLAYAAATPDDPLFSSQWALVKIAAPTAWDVVTGTHTVAIAIIDSGLDLSHEDLNSQVWVNPGEVAGNSLDDDNNGFVDDINGWDFVNDDNLPADDNGHGTQVAGITAATTNNSLGIAGLCWECRIMPVKVMQASGVANYSDIAAGVTYAADKGAEVINLSLGGYSDSHTLHSAIQYAISQNAVVIGGAGNDGVSTSFYPAAYEEVLAVAGTDESDLKTSISNFGSWVDVAAPGTAITTTFMGGDYGAVDGTSFSAAFTSGLAGLLRSQHTGWNHALVEAQILHTTDPIDGLNPGYENLLGSGRINAENAVTISPHPILAIDATEVNGDPLGRPTPGETAILQVTLGNGWLDATGVQGVLSSSDAYVTVISGTASYGDISSGGTGTGDPLYAFAVASEAGYNHAMLFNLHVTANGGGYSVDLPLTITTRSANENVGGTIGVDTTWTSDKTYIVINNVGVAPGVTLTIQAGTLVKFNGNYSLNIGGALVADGEEGQPIRFMSNTGSDWGRIYFDDTSLDATADISGTYQSGNILRWVNIESAGQGIGCNNATPYLSHVATDGGGVSCAAGDTSLWILSSDIRGDVIVNSGSVLPSLAYNVQDTTIRVGSLSLPQASQVLNSTIGGNITTAGNGTVTASIASGGITINGDGAVTGSTAGGSVSLSSGTVQNNTISNGGITIGSGSVFSNTVSGGGINAGDGSEVRGNNIENSPGWGIQAGGTVDILKNRLVGNASGILASGGLVQGNLIANQVGVGAEINGNATVISNTFTAVGGSAVKIVAGAVITVTGNNLEFNTGLYDIENLTANDIPASDNWWGTTDPDVINERIFDSHDDYHMGEVQYIPPATGPIQNAPAYVRGVTLEPESPVGIETVQFEVEFSREMDDSASQLFFGIGDIIQSTIIYPNLVSLWPGEENANDSIGTNDGSLLGSTSFTTGVFGQGFLLDSNDDGITIPYDPSLNIQLPGFSFGFWMKGVMNQPDQYFDVVDKSHACGPYSGWTFEGDSPNGGLTLAVNNGGWVRVTSGFNILDGEFHVVNGTWDGATIRLFVDGTLRGEASLTDPIDNQLPLNLGFWCNSGSRSFRGIIDEIVLYHRALSSEEIRTASITGIPITDNPQWITSDLFRASYDITSLISRGTYTITVSGAVGTDGIEIAPNTAYTFTVDYAGAIGDTTPPPAPTVLACGAASPDTLSANWYASDPESDIDRYRYAIGTTSGGIDVVNWTDTTSTSFLRDDLNLTAGQTYYVSVKARNTGGLWSEAGVSSGVVAGSGTCPSASFIANPVTGPAPLTVQFTNTSTGTITSQLWSFGDGDTGTATNPTHIYGDTGVYTVSLMVSGPAGSDLLVRSDYITVTQNITPPVASFYASPLAGQPPLAVMFTDTSAGDITAWLWNFGDGTTSTSQHPSHSYQQTGQFTVTLAVSGPYGSDIEVKPAYIQVAESAVIANFTAQPLTGAMPLLVQFSDMSFGNITTWLWDFGDGGTSVLQNPTHLYNSAGIYTVSLVVSGPDGSDSLERVGYIVVLPGNQLYLPLIKK